LAVADKIGISGVAVLGTIATTVVYMLSLTVVFGIVPTPRLAASPGPGASKGART
jgi:hypothetical protein